MIIIGYQGIGKSTLAGKDNKFIDLESGNFWVNRERAENWYIPYCQIAEHLSKQGYIVFTSSHQSVRDWFKYNGTQITATCFPSLELKDKWIEKLEKRYNESHLEKDYKALMNAKDRYEQNILELMNEEGFYQMKITDIPYSLHAGIITFIENLEKEHD